MADFEALNELRSRTLRQIREMVSEETALWSKYCDGQDISGKIAEIESYRARFGALWDQHEKIRQAMVDAGFMPPPAERDDLLTIPTLDPLRHAMEARLKAELEAARAEYDNARREFQLFVTHGTGLPAPDGNVRARQIAATHSAALRKYTGAIRQLNAFLTERNPAGE